MLFDSDSQSFARILCLGSENAACRRLAARHGWFVATAPHPAAASIRQEAYDVVLIDLDVWGLDVALTLVNGLPSPAGVLVLADSLGKEMIGRLWRLGMRNCLIKPCSESQLFFSISMFLLDHEGKYAAGGGCDQQDAASVFVGVSPFSRELRRQAKLLSSSTLPIHLTGESGVGKVVAAQEFHLQSTRKSKVFLPVNCSVLGSLAESELFGHSRGAFTSATQATRGYVGTADGGTLFLDEIGDLNPEVQTKLLRFLDSGEYLRVGESQLRHADVKVITATNKNLWQLCQQGNFRADLYYRITGAVYQLPPLRERREDIVPLARHFLGLLSRNNKQIPHFKAEVLAAMRLHEWPGNARQLRQVVHLLTDKYQGHYITIEMLANECRSISERDGFGIANISYKEAKQQTLHEFDLHFFANIVAQSKGSLKTALSISGMHKKNFYTKMKELNISLRSHSLGATVDSSEEE